MHKHLRRLEQVWIDQPIYFITACTKNRRAILTHTAITDILVDEWRTSRARHGWIVGRYVVMPDHVHFFCTAEHDAKTLSEFMRNWKSWTGKRINRLIQPGSPTPATTNVIWQSEFFDRVLRSGESYSEKWKYVRENPVRAGLVSSADEWKFAGEIETLTAL